MENKYNELLASLLEDYENYSGQDIDTFLEERCKETGITLLASQNHAASKS